jgi:hypothetical protein
MIESFTALFIKYYIYMYKVLLAIVSDRKIGFQSIFWKTFLAMLQTQLYFSIVFYPQMDGLVQKANKQVQIFLRAYISQNLND